MLYFDSLIHRLDLFPLLKCLLFILLEDNYTTYLFFYIFSPLLNPDLSLYYWFWQRTLSGQSFYTCTCIFTWDCQVWQIWRGSILDQIIVYCTDIHSSAKQVWSCCMLHVLRKDLWSFNIPWTFFIIILLLSPYWSMYILMY